MKQVIHEEIYFGKLIHAIQIVRYLRYTTGRFNWVYWRDTRNRMAATMLEESKTFKKLAKINIKGINSAIVKGMKSRSVKK